MVCRKLTVILGQQQLQCLPGDLMERCKSYLVELGEGQAPYLEVEGCSMALSPPLRRWLRRRWL